MRRVIVESPYCGRYRLQCRVCPPLPHVQKLVPKAVEGVKPAVILRAFEALPWPIPSTASNANVPISMRG